jgi:hypothetical protein
VETTQPLTEPPVNRPALTTSLLARMGNVFATPGDVFDEVKNARPCTANWLVPVLLCILMGTMSILIIYSQPAILQQINEQQTKMFEDQVQSGKMTRTQADQAEATLGKFGGPAFLKLMGIVGVVIGVFVRVFWWALVLWLLGKWFLQAGFSYQQALEVAGLAFTIMILGSLVNTLLSVCLGKITTLSLALCSGNSDLRSLSHMVLATVDVFELWLTLVMATGLARLSNTPWTRALALTLGYWLAMAGFMVSVAWLAIHLTSGHN